MKKWIIFGVVLFVVTLLISIRVGFYFGCAKVIGNYEGTYIKDDIMKSHCYGNRTMWLDDVERNLPKK